MVKNSSRESLKNTKKLSTIINAWDIYRKSERISPIKKVEYEQFLEKYYQQNFNDTVDLMEKFKASDPKIIRKFYDYQSIKREEELVRIAEAAQQYKKEIRDPQRIIAVLERIGNTNKGYKKL